MSFSSSMTCTIAKSLLISGEGADLGPSAATRLLLLLVLRKSVTHFLKVRLNVYGEGVM